MVTVRMKWGTKFKATDMDSPMIEDDVIRGGCPEPLGRHTKHKQDSRYALSVDKEASVFENRTVG